MKSVILTALALVSSQMALADPAVFFFRSVSCEIDPPVTSHEAVQKFDLLVNLDQLGLPEADGILIGELNAPEGSAAARMGLGALVKLSNDSDQRYQASLELSPGVVYKLDVNLQPAKAGGLPEGKATITEGSHIYDYKCVGFPLSL